MQCPNGWKIHSTFLADACNSPSRNSNGDADIGKHTYLGVDCIGLHPGSRHHPLKIDSSPLQQSSGCWPLSMILCRPLHWRKNCHFGYVSDDAWHMACSISCCSFCWTSLPVMIRFQHRTDGSCSFLSLQLVQ